MNFNLSEFLFDEQTNPAVLKYDLSESTELGEQE